jgi:hypothetical protein
VKTRKQKNLLPKSINPSHVFSGVESNYKFNKQRIWQNTVYPASEAENWFISATSKYWYFLNRMPTKMNSALTYTQDYFNELNYRFLYLVTREGDLEPVNTSRVYDRYNHYDIPRIKGTVLLNQLRLKLGNEDFATLMNEIHDSFREKPLSNNDFKAKLNSISGEDLTGFVEQWLERKGLPEPKVAASVAKNDDGSYLVTVTITQPEDNSYNCITDIAFYSDADVFYRAADFNGLKTELSYTLPEKPAKLVFNYSNKIPVERDNCYTMGNILDEFATATIISGTNRQLEANNTIARDWSFNLAEAYTEILIPVVKDCEITQGELKSRDLIVLGSPSENAITRYLADENLLPIDFAKNCFIWNGKTYGKHDHGIVVVMPNPWNKNRLLFLFVANSQLQMHYMTEKYRRGMPAWSVFQGSKIVDEGYDKVSRFIISLN